MKTFKDYLAEEEYDRQRDADAVSGKPRKTSVGGGKKPKGYSKDKAEKAAVDNVKKALAKNEETDYEAKKKALQDIQMDPNTSKDPELKKELARRKAELEKTKEASETNEGGMSDVMIGVDELISDFTNQGDKESGLKMPKAEVIQSIKDSGADPMEIRFAIDTINSEFDMDGNYKYAGYDETIRMKELAGISLDDEQTVEGGKRTYIPDADIPMPRLLKWEYQTDMTKALRKAAGLPDSAYVYFDDADLVYGDKTVWPMCGVDDKCTFGDAVKALKKFAKANPLGEDLDDDYGYTWNCKKCDAENEFTMTPQEKQEYINNWEEDNQDLVADGETGEGALDNLLLDQGKESGMHYGNKCTKCGTVAEDPYSESDELTRIKELANIDEETYDGDDFYNAYGDLWFNEDEVVDEAEYQGRKVKLGKPMRGDVKKFKVYVKNPKGNIVKVNFGDPDMKIKKSNPARRRSFRARHNCDNPGPRHKARYWSCRKW